MGPSLNNSLFNFWSGDRLSASCRAAASSLQGHASLSADMGLLISRSFGKDAGNRQLPKLFPLSEDVQALLRQPSLSPVQFHSLSNALCEYLEFPDIWLYWLLFRLRLLDSSAFCGPDGLARQLFSRAFEVISQVFPGRPDLLYAMLGFSGFQHLTLPHDFAACSSGDLYSQLDPLLRRCNHLWMIGSYSRLHLAYADFHLAARHVPPSDFNLRTFSLLGEASRVDRIFRFLFDSCAGLFPVPSLGNLLFLCLGAEELDSAYLSRLILAFKNHASSGPTKSVSCVSSVITPTLLSVIERPVLAVVSADFRYHPVGRFWVPIAEGLSRSFRLVHVSTNRSDGDHLTRQIRSIGDEWCIVPPDDDDALADGLASFSPSLALDLGGHTADNNPRWLLRRLAPVQLSYLGFYAPTYATNADWWITDQYLEPYIRLSYPGAEQRWVMPFPSICYDTSSHQVPDICDLSFTSSDSGAIGSFNHTRKLSLGSIQRMSCVLAGNPKSVLFIRSHSFADSAVRRWFLQKFLDAGACPSQLIVLPYASTATSALLDYSRVQLHLDTYPVSGTTTTLDSLAMGVPVLTCPNHLYAGAISAALLESMGLHHCVVHDPAELPTRAAELLKRYRTPESRRELARHVRSSLVFNTTELPRLFAEQLTEMLKQASMKAAD